MSEVLTRGDDARRACAADWLVRLGSTSLADAEAVEFDGWLSAHPANARAYDAALSVMLEVEAASAEINDRLAAAPAPRARANRRGWLVAGGLAAAATMALAVMPFSAIAPAATMTFATAKGEHRTVKLADGSTVELNAGTQLSVTLGRHQRRLVMPQGEAVFDVAADKDRPFLIAVGDRTVRVVGTRFDVRHRGDQLSVTVERGVVEVRPNDGVAGRSFRLHPGQRLDTAQGAPAVQLSVVDPRQIESWRTGRLIYRDQPLSDVIVDLNQQFARPIVLEDPALAQTRVSGVLVLDDQDAVIRRLALLAPIKATPSGSTVRLRSDRAAKP
ncbi:FecR family protein [Phenylobacterium sp.]|uniref:FecR family protein n=1 Tax=Phenylobacterium sp. TaxID=1871053 RepID=UPI00374D65CB